MSVLKCLGVDVLGCGLAFAAVSSVVAQGRGPRAGDFRGTFLFRTRGHLVAIGER